MNSCIKLSSIWFMFTHAPIDFIFYFNHRNEYKRAQEFKRETYTIFQHTQKRQFFMCLFFCLISTRANSSSLN